MRRKYSYDKDNEIFLSHYTDADGEEKKVFLFNPEDVAAVAGIEDSVLVQLHCGTKVVLASEDSAGLEAWIRNWVTPARMSTEWIESGEEQPEEQPQDLDDVKLGPGGIAFQWGKTGFRGNCRHSEWRTDSSEWVKHHTAICYGNIVAPWVDIERGSNTAPDRIIDVYDEDLLRALLNAEDAMMSQREALAKVLAQ